MIELVIFSLISFGITTIVTQSKIFRWLRDWAEGVSPYWSSLVMCPLCFGFHCGWFLSLTLFTPVGVLLGVTSVVGQLFFDACISAGVNQLLFAIHHKLWPDW
jgi:hypothetical protein